MIDLLLLGTGAMMPLAGRWLSSLLVRCRGEVTLFDCGEGTQIPWRSSNWGFRQTAAICLSHLHADHAAGLPGILHSLANSQRTELLSIYGPEGTAWVVEGLRRVVLGMPFEIEVRELREGDRIALPGGISATVLAGDHRIPSLIYRMDLGRSRRFDRAAAEALGVPVSLWSALSRGEPVTIGERLVSPDEVLGPDRKGLSLGFMTDTRPVPGVAEFLSGLDLLVSEGTYGDSAMLEKAIEHKHMTFAEAAAIARAAGVSELWLTHFSPAMREPELFVNNARAIFSNTVLGHGGLQRTLSFAEDEPSGP